MNDTPAATVIDPEDRERVLMHMRSTQRLAPAIVAGAVAAVIGAAIWAAISVFAKQEIGWIAIGLGFVVGMAVRFAGNGFEVRYAVIGAFLSLAGVVLGKFLALCGAFAQMSGVPFSDIVQNFPYQELPAIMRESFQVIDLLFYALAVWCGWKYARREIDDAEIAAAHRTLKSER